MSLRFYPAVALAAVLLSACGGLRSNMPSEQLYVLRPPTARGEGPRLDVALQLLRPVAQPGLDTARIALVQPGNRLDYFAGGRWAGPLDRVAGGVFAQTLRGSGRFAQVVTDEAGVGADYVLAVTLRRFEAEYAAAGAPPRARLNLECTLSSQAEHRQLAAFDIEASADADANRLGSVVAALQVAAQDAALQLVEQAAVHVTEALAAEPRGARK